jgi:hypothetical protein
MVADQAARLGTHIDEGDMLGAAREGFEPQRAGPGEQVKHALAFQHRPKARSEDVEHAFAHAVRRRANGIVRRRRELLAAKLSGDNPHGLAARLARTGRTTARRLATKGLATGRTATSRSTTFRTGTARLVAKALAGRTAALRAPLAGTVIATRRTAFLETALRAIGTRATRRLVAKRARRTITTIGTIAKATTRLVTKGTRRTVAEAAARLITERPCRTITTIRAITEATAGLVAKGPRGTVATIRTITKATRGLITKATLRALAATTPIVITTRAVAKIAGRTLIAIRTAAALRTLAKGLVAIGLAIAKRLLVPMAALFAERLLVTERLAIAAVGTIPTLRPITAGRTFGRATKGACRLIVLIEARLARTLGFVFLRRTTIVVEVNAARTHRTIIVAERATVIPAACIKTTTTGARAAAT